MPQPRAQRLVRGSLYLIEERGHLLLWDFWGDPDEWTLLRYEKKG